MKVIIIAAGPSSRLRPMTNDKPKCMLELNNKPLIKHAIDIFNKQGINDITVVRGYKKEKLNFEGLTYFDNDKYLENNILHSLMHAREKIEEAVASGEDVIITYSDILYDGNVLKQLISSDAGISIVTDVEWEEYYDGRTDHPISEAENAMMAPDNTLIKIGKHFSSADINNTLGEFIGLWKFTPDGARIFLNHFDRLNSVLKLTDPFQRAKEWQKSYITDIFQDMVDKGEAIHCVPIKKGWAEFDTVQDFTRYEKMLKEEEKE